MNHRAPSDSKDAVADQVSSSSNRVPRGRRWVLWSTAIALAGIVLFALLRPIQAEVQAGTAQSSIRVGMRFSEVTPLLSASKTFFFERAAAGCAAAGGDDRSACQVLRVIFGELMQYSFTVTFDADGRVSAVSDVGYLD